MASLDSLPSDQRAVLQLVLARGRSYDEIAAMLSIDRAGVRERALRALDELGPQTEIDGPRRALITDYLLGQLPARIADQVHDRLAETAAERAWARVLAAELAPLAAGSLPQIPTERFDAEPEYEPSSFYEEPGTLAAAQPDGPVDARPKSRLGGAILLGASLLTVIVVVAVLLIAGGGGSKHANSNQASASSSSSASPSSAASSLSASSAASSAAASSGGTAATGSAKPIAQVNLTSPTGSRSTGGVAIVVKQGTTTGLVVRAQGVPANSRHDAYAVWLYNSPTDNHILGFVNPPVSSNGVLQTAGALPVNASHFKQLLVSLETQPKPTSPTKIVLQGALTLSG